LQAAGQDLVVGETIRFLGILPAFSLRTGEVGGGPARWCGMDRARIRADVLENRSFTPVPLDTALGFAASGRLETHRQCHNGRA
jgi:hypothetical protein